MYIIVFFFFSSRRRHTRLTCDWSSDVCSSDLVPWRRIEADAQHLARDVLVAEARVDEVALLGREEPERARKLEERAVRDQTQRLLVVRGRDERRALGDERQPRRGRLVDVRVEEDRVVGLALAAQE